MKKRSSIRHWYTQRDWDRAVGWGKVPPEYSKPHQPKTYKYEEIFEDIPGDDEYILLNIPEEVLTSMGWKEGDTLKVSSDSYSITLEKEEDDPESILFKE